MSGFLFLFGALFLQAKTPVNAVLDCNGISISGAAGNHNGIPVFRGGESVAISVSSADSSSIRVYWKPAYQPMNQTSGWTEIPGSFNSLYNSFSAPWTVPSKPQEIILAANSFGSGGLCSGNPCSTYCPQGAYWETGGVPICGTQQPASCCSGCQKLIIVDPLFGFSGINMKTYFNLVPGYSWQFQGTNYTYPTGDPSRNFVARIETEAPMTACGHKYLPMRFLKNKASGYISPLNYGGTASRWAGAWAVRWFTTGFFADAKWNNKFMGTLGAIGYYLLPGAESLKGLGDMPAGTGGSNTYLTSGSQHFYYPPYFLSPNYLPDNPTQWSFIRSDDIDAFVDPRVSGSMCKYNGPPWSNDWNNRTRGWETLYGWENVSTPGFSGQALRIIFLEYGTPANSYLLREDWLLAQNIGVVEIRQKYLDRIGIHWENCTTDCSNSQMQNPNIDMKVYTYYSGNPMVISSPSRVQNGTLWQMRVTDSSGKPYTGWMAVHADHVNKDGYAYSEDFERWAWAENGLMEVVVPTNLPERTSTISVRAAVPKADTAHKGIDEKYDSSFSTNLPWSNSLTITFSNSAYSVPTLYPTPTTSITVGDLKTLLLNYLGTQDGAYKPVDGKINMLDGGYVLNKIL